MKLTGSSRFNALSDFATRLPWWGALLLALAAYVLLHPIATLQLPAPAGMVDVATTALSRLFVSLAQIAQYLLPLAFLLSAAVSGFGRWKRTDLRVSVAQDTTGSILRGLSWSDFALLVAEAFRRRGYEVPESHTATWDKGAPLEMTRNHQRYLIDCTDWRSGNAGAGAVRSLYEQIEATGAKGGFAVTSGRFTPEAKHFVVDRNIELIDGRHLKDLVRAAPEPAPGNTPALVAHLRSLLTRWQLLVSSHSRTANLVAGTSAQEMRPDIERPPRVRPARDLPDLELPAANDAEVAAGEELTALIRADSRMDEEIERSAPPVEIPVTRRPPHVRRHKRPIRRRKIVDAVGILIAMGILWGVYDWFATLPDTPTDTPWALMGTGGDSEVLARRSRGLQRSGLGDDAPDSEGPLGQFQFGPSGLIADLEAKARERAGYHGLRELENAFDDKYVPPPECFAWESSDQMVKCGNHRIRARRDFIASGGEVTPTLLGSWEEPRGGWDPDSSTEQNTRQHWDQEYALEPDGDWQPGYRQGRQNGLRRPEVEDPPQTAWDRVDQRPPDIDWQRESPREWRQVPAEPPPLEPQQDWRQDWLRGSGPEPSQSWQREWAGQPRRDSDSGRDWQQDWLRTPRQNADQDWRQRWESEPAPAERRHWVDDL